MYKPNSTWTWAFVGITLVQAAIILSCESYVFAKFQINLISSERRKMEHPDSQDQDHPESQTIPTFLTLYIFAFLFQLLLVFDALRAKNTIQVIGLCMFNAALLLYAAIQLTQIRDAVHTLTNNKFLAAGVWSAVKPYLIAVPCIIALGLVLMSAAAWKLYDEFAWSIYKEIVSADLKLKRRYLTYQIYIALLKFDFFFFLGFTIQFVVIVVQDKRSVEFGLTLAAIPVTITILFLAAVFTRRESKVGMFGVITLYFGGLAYFLYKVVRMYHSSPEKEKKYKPVRKSLTTFAVITIILILLTIVNACICTANFGQRLKDVIAGRKVDVEEQKDSLEMSSLAHGSVPQNRMTID